MPASLVTKRIACDAVRALWLILNVSCPRTKPGKARNIAVKSTDRRKIDCRIDNLLFHDFRALLIEEPIFTVRTKKLDPFLPEFLPVAVEFSLTFRASDPEDL